MTKKILIVDDEPHIRILLEQTLDGFIDLGVKILTADNGQSAIEIIKSEKPGLVFLDVMMPTVSGAEVCGSSRQKLVIFEDPEEKNEIGFEVCKVIKKELNMKNIYIAILTAKGQDIDREKGYDAGVDIYLNKPFDPDRIVKIASEVLNIQI
jgi:DNA-binding response OmpR family regulator